MYNKCSDATLLTSNGVGTVKVIGNVDITETIHTSGDILIGGDSNIDGNYSVNGTSQWSKSATISPPSSLTIPAIYANNVYQTQPVSTVGNGTVTLNTSNNSLTGTTFLIHTNNNLTFNLGTQAIGSNYKALVSNTTGSSGMLSFTSTSPINWVITGGNVSQQGTFVDSRAHNLVGNVIAIMVSPYINYNSLVDVCHGSGSLVLANTLLTVGDSFEFTFDGSRWIITGYTGNFSSLQF